MKLPLIAAAASLLASTASAADYAVVVSDTTYADAGWRKVTEALAAKHHATIVTHPAGKPAAARDALAKLAPTYAAFVTRPDECGRVYCADVFRMIRALDADPYEDAIWGIVTGVDAAAALRQVETGRDIEIHHGLGTTGLTESRFQSLFVLSDAKEGDWVSLKPGEPMQRGHGHAKSDPSVWADRFAALKPELIVTSAHGFQDGVEMPFSRGMIRTHGDTLRGMDISARLSLRDAAKADRTGLLNRLPMIEPESTPRAWLAAGNCLTGHCHTADSLVAVTMSRYGVYQFAGYSVVSWHGAAGWGALGLFLDGRTAHTMAESIWFNRQRILAELAAITPAALTYNYAYDETDRTGNDVDAFFKTVAKSGVTPSSGLSGEASRRLIGHLWDRDTFVMYGDPALAVRFPSAVKPGAPTTTCVESSPGHWRFRAVWPAGTDLKGMPPLAYRFAKKFTGAPHVSETTAQTGLILADDFLLVPAPNPDADGTLTVEFDSPPAR